MNNTNLQTYTSECSANSYRDKDDQCAPCHEDTECINNTVKVRQSHYISVGYDKDEGMDRMVASICPPGYCCNERDGCEWTPLEVGDKVIGVGPNLCGQNRDSNARLCGKCLEGYEETFSSIGNCRKCQDWQRFRALLAQLFLGFFAVFVVFEVSIKERSVPNPFWTYVNRTLFFYYQVVAWLTFKAYVPLLWGITDFANLNISFSGGACLPLKGDFVGPRVKLVLSLTMPCILLLAFCILLAKYLYYKRLVKDKKMEVRPGWWNRRVIALTNTGDFIMRVAYLQVTYIFIRLIVFSKFSLDGKYYFWYAGEVTCFDVGHWFSILAFVLLAFIVPAALYQTQKWYKQNDPEKFEKLFASTILSYRQPCWYYGVWDLWRRIPICFISIMTYTSLMVVTTGIIMMVHCILMPYRWRANNLLEGYVLLIMFVSAAVNDSDLDEVEVSGQVINFSWLLYMFAVMPLLPLPWLLYESSADSVETNLTYLKSMHCKTFEENELTKPSLWKFGFVLCCKCKKYRDQSINNKRDDDIIQFAYSLRGKTYVFYTGDVKPTIERDRTGNVSVDVPLLNTDDKSNSPNNIAREFSTEQFERLDTAEMDEVKEEVEDNSMSAHSAISAKPTRSGWEYPFKIDWGTLANIFKRKKGSDQDDDDDLQITLDLHVTFSTALPTNTFIDAADLGQHIENATKATRCSITVDGIRGKRKDYFIAFTARFENTSGLDSNLVQNSKNIAMDIAIFDALDNNEKIKEDLLKSFKSKLINESHQIVKVTVENSEITAANRNKFLKETLYKKMQDEDKGLRVIIEKLKHKPLNKWLPADVFNAIKYWVLNDCLYQERREKMMNIFSEKSFSGKNLINYGNEVKIVLNNAIGSLMTEATFKKIFKHLEHKKGTDKERLLLTNAPQLALELCKVPLDNLEEMITGSCPESKHKKSTVTTDGEHIKRTLIGSMARMNRIGGEEFEKLYEDNDPWIFEATGWNKDEICQIENFILKYKTDGKQKMEDRLKAALDDSLDQMQLGDDFIQRCYDTILSNRNEADKYTPEYKIDFEELHLKLRNGHVIDKEFRKLTNIIDLLQYRYQATYVENAKMKKTEDDFLPRIIEAISMCFVSNAESRQYRTSTRTNQPSMIMSLPTLRDQLSLAKADRRKILKQTDWTCANCSNFNHKFHVQSELKTNWERCILCGTTELHSVKIALSGAYTYVSAVRSLVKEQNESDEEEKNDNDGNKEEESNNNPLFSKQEKIDKERFDRIQKAREKLRCPLRPQSEHGPCQHIERLIVQLLNYQEWIKKIRAGNSNNTPSVKDTSEVDISQVDNEVFEKLVLDTANGMKQFKKEHITELMLLFGNDDLSIEIFAKKYQKASPFKRAFGKKTSIKAGTWGKFHKLFLPKLQEAAGKLKNDGFSVYIDSIDIQQIDDDFFHVLHHHIKYSAQSKWNTFEYFNAMIECVGVCDSMERKNERVKRFAANEQVELKENDEESQENRNDLNVFALKQRYVQNNLDLMHSFLVHGQQHVASYKNDHKENGNYVTSPSLSELQKDKSEVNVPKYTSSMTKMEMPDNTDKFSTEVDEKANVAQYGFGVDHSYPYLKPERTNIRDELLFNKVCQILIGDFEDLMMKALEHQRLALKKNLRCKHYVYEYNIIRNEPIGIRHILAIIVYTDMTSFCRAYRETYRRMVKYAKKKNKENESDEDVTARHQALYFYSRALFEAIEFFGDSMKPDMKVWHGLNKEMMFDRFTAYFNQPISTTVDINAAKEFAKDDGIILEFRRGGSSQIPKYLDVSWLSHFPGEDERLFYGNNIVFEIADIFQDRGTRKHRQELRILNMFQSMMRNQQVLWIKKNEKESNRLQQDIALLVTLINQETGYKDDHDNIFDEDMDFDTTNMEHDDEQKYEKEYAGSHRTGTKMRSMIQISEKNHALSAPVIQTPKEIALRSKQKISEYGQKLFKHFCENPKTSWICINNYELIPSELKLALLQKRENTVVMLSFVKLLKLFSCLQSITLNELNVNQLTEQSRLYVDAVKKCIKAMKSGEVESRLKEIVFESVDDEDGKRNSTLQKLAAKYKENYKKENAEWTIEYDFRLEKSHTLTFKIKSI